MRKKLLRHFLFFLLIFSAPSIPWAAVNPLFKAIGKPAGTQPPPPAAAELTDEGIAESRKKLESRLADLRLQLHPDSIAALRNTYRDVATPQELAEWERLANRLAGLLDNHINTLVRLGNIRKANRDRAEDNKMWQGFTEKPPYPVSLLDSLSDAIHGKEIDLSSLDVMRVTARGELDEYSAALRNSRKQVRLAEENAEKNAGKPGERRSQWLLTLARLRDSLNEAGVVYGDARRLMIKEAQEGLKADIEFLRRKLAAARADYRFTEAELELKLRDIDSRAEQLRRELDQAERDAEQARKRLDAGAAEIRAAQDRLARGEKESAPLDRLLQDQERRQVLFDAADFRVQTLREMIFLFNKEKEVWQDRYRLAGGEVGPEERSELRKNRNDLAVLAKWKEYVGSQLAGLQVLIKSRQEKLSSASLSEADRQDIRAILAAYQGQDALLRRGETYLDEYERLLVRRNEEAKGKEEKATPGAWARVALDTVYSLAGRIWNAELYVAEETIIAEGKKIVRPRSVTLGKLVEALIILLAGSWALRHLKRQIPRIMVKRLELGAHDAQLYGRLITYLLFIGLFASALIFVNIPLAVFAFLGGALAIGIGFGAQNLINNFISGLILMFDRTIRVGDVVEVDGQRGRVAAIGMRSSSIKRFDGIEMIVPNSLFLQQNVTNWTSSDKRVRYSVSVGVAYGSNTMETSRVILKAVEEQPEVLRDPTAYVVFDNFADSSLNFTAYFWIELDPSVNSLIVFSDIRHRIGERLAEAGIEIPFPQRDVRLDAGKPLEIRVSRPERH
ncbi:MAG TPA: mechanosensitive ion channel domain-containing protein [Geobacteraceae bacterium]|nr:mechanosensitive ion channel domain-containing protein [Geobacteraceae bacterium]